MTRGFKDETTKIECQGKGVTEGHRFCSVAQPEGRRALKLSASLGGIAALGIGLSADAEFPEIGTDLQVTRQAD